MVGTPRAKMTRPPPYGAPDRFEDEPEIRAWIFTHLKTALAERTDDSLEQARTAYKCAEEAYCNSQDMSSPLGRALKAAKFALLWAEKVEEAYLWIRRQREAK